MDQVSLKEARDRPKEESGGVAKVVYAEKVYSVLASPRFLASSLRVTFFGGK